MLMIFFRHLLHISGHIVQSAGVGKKSKIKMKKIIPAK